MNKCNYNYLSKYRKEKLQVDSRAATNIVLAIGRLNGFVSIEVQNSAFVLQMKFSAKNPAHRQYENR